MYPTRANCIRRSAALVIVIVLFLAGCATTPATRTDDVPILSQDELLRPYVKVGNLEVNRDFFGVDEQLNPVDYEWVLRALRDEARKAGADAVILPEVTMGTDSFLLFPYTVVKAKGVAIKFR